MNDARFEPLKRIPVLEETLPDANPPVRRVRGARIRFAPGQPTGLHQHAMSTCGVVTAGSFIYQREGSEPVTLATGDGFFEPAGHTIVRFDNASDVEPAEIVAYYLMGEAELPSIDMLAGGMDAQIGRR